MWIRAHARIGGAGQLMENIAVLGGAPLDVPDPPHICQPMDGQVVYPNEPFIDGEGLAVEHDGGAHPNCWFRGALVRALPDAARLARMPTPSSGASHRHEFASILHFLFLMENLT
jgi:hypothetical protein